MRPPLIPPVHREGWPFIAGFAVVAILLSLFSHTLGAVGLLLTLWCAWFFRDPPRTTPSREGLVIAPADGVVTLIEPAVPPAELGVGSAPRMRVSIFMNVFDVHVNRAPAAATVTKIAYRPGRFLNAALDKASEENERQSLRFQLPDGRDLLVVQIAGLVARRIIGWVPEGQVMQAGERFGMIRFGSRVDVYLPDGVEPLVCEGQQSVAGETILADLTSGEARRAGRLA